MIRGGAYERLEMALHDYPVRRTMAMGIAGLAVVADSLSAIRDARVKVIRDESGLVVDYEVEGDYPAYGNNDDRVDQLAVWVVERFMGKVRQHPAYRDAIHTQSVLGRMLDEIARYEQFIKTAHGGITVSGGEPMLQIRFLEALLRRCKTDLGLHTAVDTSGFLGARASEDFLDLVDLFLLDIKAGDEQLYHLVTSAELEPTLRFARRLSDHGNRMWVRYVLVPGLTDAEDDVEKVARFTGTLNCVDRIEVLPFHQLGASKWADLQLPYQLADVPPAPPELVRRVEDQFRAHGLTVV